MRILLLALILLNWAAAAETVTLPGPQGVMLRAELHRPAGVARGAVVALHGCGGPFGARDRQWSEALTAAGQIVLFPDSFGSRGLGSQCRAQGRTVTASGLRRGDAIAAAAWLAAQPGVPPGRMVLLGWSDGGSTVLAVAQAGKGLPGDLFRRFIAFYPGCRVASVTKGWAAEGRIDILMGEADDWTPIAPCRMLAARAAGVTLHAFAGAYHDFDAPVPVRVMRDIPTSQNADHSVHVGGDAAARAAALVLVPHLLEAE